MRIIRLLIDNDEISILFGSFSVSHVQVHLPLRHNLSRLCVAAISRHSMEKGCRIDHLLFLGTIAN